MNGVMGYGEDEVRTPHTLSMEGHVSCCTWSTASMTCQVHAFIGMRYRSLDYFKLD